MAVVLVVLAVTLLVAVVVIGWLLVAKTRYPARHAYTAGEVRVKQRASVAASRSTVATKVWEQLAPLLPEFAAEFNPRDARSLGGPVDLVVFDGLDAGFLERVVFVEVKTRRAGLNGHERLVRDAVTAGRVEFQVLPLPALGATAGEPVSVAFDAGDALGLDPRCARNRRGRIHASTIKAR